MKINLHSISGQVRSRFLAAGLLTTLSPAVTQATVVWQPSGASTTMATLNGTSPSDTINQSGLNSPYTTGVTDFDAYVASNPTHDISSTNKFWESDFAPTGNFDFDLGASVPLNSMIFWNDVVGSPSVVTSFNLYADDNAGFTSPTLLGSFTTSFPNGTVNAVTPDVFTFASTQASHVRMQITGNGGAFDTRFGEVAFGVVPEPSVALLSLIGGLALLRRRRHS